MAGSLQSLGVSRGEVAPVAFEIVLPRLGAKSLTGLRSLRPQGYEPKRSSRKILVNDLMVENGIG